MLLIFREAKTLAHYKALLKDIIRFNQDVMNSLDERINNLEIKDNTAILDSCGDLSLVNNLTLIQLKDGRIGLLTTSAPDLTQGEGGYEIIRKEDIYLISTSLKAINEVGELTSATVYVPA